MSYLVWKLVHVVAVILFLGNITTGLFWAAHAHRTRDFRLIASTFEGIIRSDRLLTVPGVVGIVVGGVAAALAGNLPMLSTGWIFWPIVLFTISGVVFGVWVAPLQREILSVARVADSNGQAWDNYSRLYKRWEVYGWLALLTPALAVAIMVLKPVLPGL